MENLGLEQIQNLRVYKCEVSRDLTVTKRGLNSRATVGEILHVKNYPRKSEEKESKSQSRWWHDAKETSLGILRTTKEEGCHFEKRWLLCIKEKQKQLKFKMWVKRGCRERRMSQERFFTLFFKGFFFLMWAIFKKSLLIVPILSLFYVLGLLASEAGGILFPKRTEGLGWEADKHFTIFIVLLGLCILCIYWSLNKKLLFF